MLDLIPCPRVEDWDRQLADQPRASVFHRSDWLELIRRLTGAELHRFLLGRRGEPVGVLPLFTFRRGPFRIAASPPAQAATPYLGPLVPDDLAEDALAALSAAARRLKASYVEMRLDRELEARVLGAARMQHEHRSTYLLDLHPGPDELWQKSLSSTCRRAVRKAQASGVAIEEAELADFVDRYADLAVGVFAKSNRPPPLDRDDYGAVAELQRRSNCIKVFVARLDGAVAAAGIFPHGNGAVYYLDGVSDPAMQQARPNNLLHWEVIRWACAAGLTRYDMVGAGIAGVARFKQGFGPAEVPYTYAYRSVSPLARAARAAYARLAPAARAAQFFARKRRTEN